MKMNCQTLNGHFSPCSSQGLSYLALCFSFECYLVRLPSFHRCAGLSERALNGLHPSGLTSPRLAALPTICCHFALAKSTTWLRVIREVPSLNCRAIP